MLSIVVVFLRTLLAGRFEIHGQIKRDDIPVFPFPGKVYLKLSSGDFFKGVQKSGNFAIFTRFTKMHDSFPILSHKMKKPADNQQVSINNRTRGGNRTRTILLSLDFESSASTNSATRAESTVFGSAAQR